MNSRAQVACAWAGFLGIALTLVALIVADFLPPPAAVDSAEELATFYRDNADRIRTGAFLGVLATGGFGALVAVTWVQLRDAQTRRPVLAALQLVAGAVTYVALLMTFTAIGVASFRPERSPETTQLMHDLAWFCLLFTVMAPASQAIAAGLAILGDTGANPAFPRWLGYLGVWAGISFIPGVALDFFKDGLFAYERVVPFWIPLLAFGAWVSALSWGCRRAALAEPAPAV